MPARTAAARWGPLSILAPLLLAAREALTAPQSSGGEVPRGRRLDAGASWGSPCEDYQAVQISGISGGEAASCEDFLAAAEALGTGCSAGLPELYASAVGLSQTVQEVCCAACSPNLVPVALEVGTEAELSLALSSKKVAYDVLLTASVAVEKPLWVDGKKRVTGRGQVVLSGGGMRSIFNVADGAMLQVENLTLEDASGAAVCVFHGGDLAVVGSVLRNNRNLQSRRLEARRPAGARSGSAAYCSGLSTGVQNVTLPSGTETQVYCDGETDGGGWVLLLSHVDSIEQYTCESIPTLHGCPGMPGSTEENVYDGSASPFGHDLSADDPSPTDAYSRNWTSIGLEPQIGDEFLLKRGTTGDWVRFVQLGPWCGWDQTRNCMPWVDRDTAHGFYTMGTVYDSSGNEFVSGGSSGTERFKYFNSCTKAGGCMRSGNDGVGFGVLESHLRATDGNGGFGGTWGPPCFRWNGDECDQGAQLPYTYWHRMGTTGITETPLWMMPCTEGGGAVAAEGDNNIVIQDSVFYGNEALLGGAMHFKASEAGDYFTKPSSHVSLSGVVVSENTATYDGGGISVAGTNNNRQVYLDIAASRIEGNSAGVATEDRGGAISINKGFLTMSGTNVLNNTADIGGGISLRNANARLELCTIGANLAVTRRGFSGGLSIEDASTVSMEGVEFVENLAIPSSGDPTQPGVDIYLGDGSLSCGSACGAGSYEAGLVVADCADAYYAGCDPVCYSTTPDPATCSPCGQGTYNPLRGALNISACLPCAPGTSSSALGVSLQGCDACEAGTFSEAGAQACTQCAPGTHAAVIGSTACADCSAGTFAANPGVSECHICNMSSYSDAPGSTECTICPADKVTTAPLSTSASACRCQVGHLALGGGGCGACDGEHLECPGGVLDGQVLTKTGFYLLAPAPESAAGSFTEVPELFRCLSEEDCPGSLGPGVCPQGHAGIACAECTGGFSRVGGACEECKSTRVRFAVLLILGPPVFLTCMGGVLWMASKPYEHQVTLGSTMGSTLGVLVTSLQLYFILFEMEVQWPDSFRITVIELAKAVVIDEANLGLDCYWKYPPLAKFSAKLFVFLVSLLSLAALWAGCRRFVGAGRLLGAGALLNAWGFVSSLAFVPLAVHASQVLNCYEHPGGRWSMRSMPSMLCYETEWTRTMLPAGIATFVVFVLGMYTVFVYLTIRLPRMESASASVGFLLLRFRPDVYYWSVIMYSRNLLLSVAPVVAPDKPFVVAVLFVLVCTAYMAMVVVYRPWKLGHHNALDVVVTGALATTLVAGASFANAQTYPNSTDHYDSSWIFLIVCVVAPFFISIACMLLVIYNFWASEAQRDNRAAATLFRQVLHEMATKADPVFALVETDPEAERVLMQNLENFGPHDISTTRWACLLISGLLIGASSTRSSLTRLTSAPSDLIASFDPAGWKAEESSIPNKAEPASPREPRVDQESHGYCRPCRASVAVSHVAPVRVPQLSV